MLVKCQICKKKIERDLAYKYLKNVKNKDKPQNKYYCSRDEFHKKLIDKKLYRKCQYATDEIMGYAIANNSRNKMLSELGEKFSYELILECINYFKRDIKMYMDRKGIDKEYQRLRYMFSVIENNIKDFEVHYKNKKKTEEVFKEEVEVTKVETKISVRNRRKSLKDRLKR